MIERLWSSVGRPDDEELRGLARRAAAGPQHAGAPVWRRRRLRARWAFALAAVALLVGSGLGFSLGSSVTPSGDAGRNVVGFGFLPDRGWNVVQRGGATPGTTTAIASKDGIVISVTSTPRGDPAEDIAYSLRELPLRVADARPISGDPTRLELRAAVGAYNIDATVSLPGERPTTATLVSAQRQLNRLVVAAAKVTIAVRPSVLGPRALAGTAFGTIDSGKAGESVTIQAKDCGTSFFRVFAGASTEAGGSWSTIIYPRLTTTLRAVWDEETSSEVVVRVQVFVGLRQLSATTFRVGPVGYGARFTGKLVTIQRLDQRVGRWQKVKLVKADSERGARFSLRVPRGTRLRAIFPTSQAKPCYLGATSPVIRT